jgi:glucosamine--fructose-6-phosphate aminotransferase (isomerizing)
MISRNEVGPRLLPSLHRVDYSGYESAGLTVLHQGQFLTEKVLGDMDRLAPFVAGLPAVSIGMGHLRGVTHGVPSLRNAHPHFSADGRFAIVHNGIVRNADCLRELLIQTRTLLYSDTDSELIVQLIAQKYYNSSLQAVRDTIFQLEGFFSFVLMDLEDPNRLIAVNKGTPMLIGVSQDSLYVASGMAALYEVADEIMILGDEEIAELTPSGYRISNFYDLTVMQEPRPMMRLARKTLDLRV